MLYTTLAPSGQSCGRRSSGRLRDVHLAPVVAVRQVDLFEDGFARGTGRNWNQDCGEKCGESAGSRVKRLGLDQAQRRAGRDRRRFWSCS